MIPLEHKKRLESILALSWNIFQNQFIYGKHSITKEAPFQHYFANIINSVGQLYCITREDRFVVDLEAKCLNIRDKHKYIDITCEFVGKAKCAIELKFKTAQQGAQDHGRIDAYLDIEALELMLENGYDFGIFFMITDSKAYINKSKNGLTALEFAIHQGYTTTPNNQLISKSKGRDNIRIKLNNEYNFDWKNMEDWYFLNLIVQK